MNCPFCHNIINDSAVFCNRCGKKVPRCPTCGTLITKPLKYCVNDGTPIPEEILLQFPRETEKTSFCIDCGAPCEAGKKRCSDCQKRAQKRGKWRHSVVKGCIRLLVVLLLITALGATCYFLYQNHQLPPMLNDLIEEWFPNVKVRDDADVSVTPEPTIYLTAEPTPAPTPTATPLPTPTMTPTLTPTPTPTPIVGLSVIPANAQTLTGSGMGKFGEVTVEVIASADKIYSITVTSHNETLGIGTLAVDALPGAIVEQQNVDVDGISSATYTSTAIKTAVISALESGGIDPAAFGVATAVTESNFTTAPKICASETMTIGLRDNGTVIAAGYPNEEDLSWLSPSGWSDITDIDCSSTTIIGLRADGTVAFLGWDSENMKADTAKWTEIVAIAASYNHTVGVRSDRTVVAAGTNNYGQCNVDQWTDIVSVSAGPFHTVGLRTDGTVLATGHNDFGECNVEDWTNIVAISAGTSHTVGLRADGTVLATGHNGGECNVEDWTNIVAISAGSFHTVGLRSDGTVVAVGINELGQFDEVVSWSGIVAIAAGEFHTVGLKADGTVVAVGGNENGVCDVSNFQLVCGN